MEFFIQLLVNGLSIGFIYGLAAMGFVMIFKSSSVLNFAHGELMALGAFVFLVLIGWAELPVYVAFPLALAGSFILGFVVERLFLRPLIGEPLIYVIMLTVGLASIFKGIMLLIWGGEPLYLSRFSPGGSCHTLGEYKHTPSLCRVGRCWLDISYAFWTLFQIFLPGDLYAIGCG